MLVLLALARRHRAVFLGGTLAPFMREQMLSIAGRHRRADRGAGGAGARRPLQRRGAGRDRAVAGAALSERGRQGRNRAQLLRRAQDRHQRRRRLSRADARHDHSRRAEAAQHRRHAGAGPAGDDHLLSRGRRHRRRDRGDARAQGRRAARRGDRARRRHADLPEARRAKTGSSSRSTSR